MAAALGMGVVLLAGAYVVGTVNRFREGRWPLALVASSGLAGAGLFTGSGLVVLGLAVGPGWLVPVGATVAGVGLVLSYVGFLAAAGGGAAGVTQATVELFDAVIRLGTNVVSFSRLAAFGLTHAALGKVVWDGTTALAERGGAAVAGAVVLFLVGNAIAFTLEALVAGVQALRLEYYEIFSRVFSTEGRPFRPWHVAVDPAYRPEAGPSMAAPNPPTSWRGPHDRLADRPALARRRSGRGSSEARRPAGLGAGQRVARRRRQEAEGLVALASREAAAVGVPVEGTVVTGEAAQSLLAEAAWGADLVVLGRQVAHPGSAGVAGRGLGGTTRQVLEFCRCPVLVVPPPGADS